MNFSNDNYLAGFLKAASTLSERVQQSIAHPVVRTPNIKTPNVPTASVKSPNVPAPNVAAPNVPAPNVPAPNVSGTKAQQLPQAQLPRATPTPKASIPAPTNLGATTNRLGKVNTPVPPALLRAMNQVEASGQEGNIPGSNDHGLAKGPFQTHQGYYQDATNFTPSLGVGHTYNDVTNRAYASKIVESYMNRYAPKSLEAGNLENMARIHNGGPSGYKNENTEGYWEKIQKALGR